MSIKLLDPQTASKIAAGEVIERPAGVLKELIENSLDAGAKNINIDISKAGKALIRVNDDGCGIKKEELTLAIKRHTTSKITNFDDLNKLNTFGFRGEALYSLAAVSKLKISSCQSEEAGGAMIEAAGGQISAQAAAPAIKGTTIEVKDLFFNTPARLKFLKSDNVERGHLLRTIEEAALANINTAFNVNTDGVSVYRLNAQEDSEQGLRTRLNKILGQELAKNLLFCQDESFGFKAFISPLNNLCASRDNQFFFINKRPVLSKVLQQALYKAYQPYRAKEKHPCAIIFLTLNPAEFDVNIHPQKKDIKFAFESDIFNFIYNKITKTLLQEQQVSQPVLAENFATQQEQFIPEQKEKETDTQENIPLDLSEIINKHLGEQKQDLFINDFEERKEYFTAPHQQEVEPEPELKQKTSNYPKWWQGPYNYLGQIHQSFLVFENPQGLVLVDQHAAQERVLFEKYFKEIQIGNVASQPLMFPISVQMPSSTLEQVLNYKDFLLKIGFEISRFSATCLMVNSVPNILKFKEEDLKDFIVALPQDLKADEANLKYKLVAMRACKRAIKAGEKLNKEQVEALMENLKKCEDALHCPHGRPTILTFTTSEIAKRFERT
ncbi:MAG: DNA mismatch repair endonuclease MutL [Elusimicrobiaceae bacterium]|nr:DNA mismatch repair endonuclease MutL [Elusimicrobiaceae bacterium]